MKPANSPLRPHASPIEGLLPRRRFLQLGLGALATLPTLANTNRRDLRWERYPDAVMLRGKPGQTPLRYQIDTPADSKLSVSSSCYFHPFTTPSGEVITDLAPDDHPHHRGIFLAWVEMHGQHHGDFWGWGAHAPKEGRRIVNRSISLSAPGTNPSLSATNAWLADQTPLLTEQLNAAFKTSDRMNVLDLDYTLAPAADLTLAQWAFSGFCVRTRRDGTVTAWSPTGMAAHKDPVHTQPKSNWPAAPWYGFTITLADRTAVSVVVMDHPSNPPTLWHNHRSTRMINPAITAPGPVVLPAARPTRLRYQVLAMDGPIPVRRVNALARRWRNA